MFESIMASLGSMFGDAGLWGEIGSAAGEVGSWLMDSPSDGKGIMSSNLMSAASAAIGGVGKMSAMGQMSHPHATSTAFHYQSTANPDTVTKALPNLFKNDINVNSGLQAMRGMKW